MDLKLFFANAEVSLLTRLNGYLSPEVTGKSAAVRHPWLFEFFKRLETVSFETVSHLSLADSCWI